MGEISGVPSAVESRRDFAPAQRTILALHQAGELNEAALLGFAKAYKYEESVAALSAMSGVKIATLDRLIAGDRYDPILIVGKVIGLEWATVRALILLRLGPNRVPSPVGHRKRARQFRAPDALDRRARGDVLADPPIGVSLRLVRCSRSDECTVPSAKRRAMLPSQARHSATGRSRMLTKPTFNRTPTESATTDTP